MRNGMSRLNFLMEPILKLLAIEIVTDHIQITPQITILRDDVLYTPLRQMLQNLPSTSSEIFSTNIQMFIFTSLALEQLNTLLQSSERPFPRIQLEETSEVLVCNLPVSF